MIHSQSLRPLLSSNRNYRTPPDGLGYSERCGYGPRHLLVPSFQVVARCDYT